MFERNDHVDPIELRRRHSVFTMVPMREAALSPVATRTEHDAADELATGVADDDMRDDWIPRSGAGQFHSLRARAKSAPASPAKLSSTTTSLYPRSEDRGELERRPCFTYGIVGVNIAIFVVTLAVAGFRFAPLSQNPLLGPDTAVLRRMGAKDTGLIHNGEWWRVLTSAFLHSSIGHLAINMIVMFRVGGSMEETFGAVSMVIVYFGSMIVAILASCVLLPSLMTVGASGAIYGVVGSMVADYLQNYEIMPAQAMYLPSLLFNVALGFAIGLLPFIDNFSHIAGFIGGLLIGLGVLILPKYDAARNRFYKSRQALAMGVAGAATFCVLLTALIVMVANSVDLNQYCAVCKYLSCVPTSYWCCQLPDRYMNC